MSVRFLVMRCGDCREYTLEDACPACGGATESAHPAKFSPDDKYMRYRLKSRYQQDGETAPAPDGP